MFLKIHHKNIPPQKIYVTFNYRIVLINSGEAKLRLLRRGRSDELFLLFFFLVVEPSFDEEGGGGMIGGDGPHIRRPLRLRNM